MKQERKEALLHSFPAVPNDIMQDMEGKGAANFVVLLTNGDELFARCFHRYSTGAVIERQRYVFARDGYVRYGSNDDEPWAIRKEFREPVFCQSCYGYAFNNTYYLWNREAIGKSCMKYSAVELYTGGYFFEYMRLYCRHPNLEYLMKAGYDDLIVHTTAGYYGTQAQLSIHSAVNLKSNDLLKMLGLNRTEFKALKGNENEYRDYIRWRDIYPKIKPADLVMISRKFSPSSGILKNIIDRTRLTPQRIARYLTEQDILPNDYRDYLDQCSTLKYDLHDTAVCLPYDFEAMHIRLSMVIKYKMSEEAQKAFAENYEDRRQLEFAYGGLFIRQPESIDEIVKEGKALCHCVGGYADRHAHHILHILFIRSADAPDEPYYTVELGTSGEIKQVRGYRNRAPGKNVKDFMKAYEKYLKGIFHRKKLRKKAKSA